MTTWDPQYVSWIQAFVAIGLGVLILVRPKIFYYFVAAYLLLLGIIGLSTGMPMAGSVVAIVAGILIVIFPQFVSFLLGGYMLVACALFLAAGQWWAAVIPGLVGLLLFSLPNLIAWVSAVYLILTGIMFLLA